MKINSAGCTFQPLIIIGAARSGTKLLRDLIALHTEIDKVPYDVNYIWRFGNESQNNDELGSENITPKIQKYIQRQLLNYHRGHSVLIEKTVSNCLRVPFVDAVYPKARYIHLIRDGYDVIESSYRQWTASPDWRYILQKARTFPIASAPSYAIKYSIAIASKMVRNQEKPRSTWGPIYKGMLDDLEELSLLEVCAIQWQKCVLHSMGELDALPSKRVMTVQYADFVQAPQEVLKSVFTFSGLDSSVCQHINYSEIQSNNLGKGRRLLSEEQADLISTYVDEVQKELSGNISSVK